MTTKVEECLLQEATGTLRFSRKQVDQVYRVLKRYDFMGKLSLLELKTWQVKLMSQTDASYSNVIMLNNRKK